MRIQRVKRGDCREEGELRGSLPNRVTLNFRSGRSGKRGEGAAYDEGAVSASEVRSMGKVRSTPHSS